MKEQFKVHSSSIYLVESADKSIYVILKSVKRNNREEYTICFDYWKYCKTRREMILTFENKSHIVCRPNSKVGALKVEAQNGTFEKSKSITS